MTIFTELGGDEFAPVAALAVGDEFQGEVGGDNGFGTPVDREDTIVVSLVAGTTYTFEVIKTNEAHVMEMSVSFGGTEVPVVSAPAPERPTVTTYTFTAETTGPFDLEVTGYSFGFTGGPSGTPIALLGAANYQVVLVSAELAGPTNGDDDITGGEGPTTLDLLDGDDTYTGEGDVALFVPGGFEDSISGGAGEDSLFGGIGNDKMDGGLDDDLIDLGSGNDAAWGGEGNDLIFGGTGKDILNGNSGDDEIFGGKGKDLIRGGKGEDIIDGGGQSDEIYGGAQSDTIYGGFGNDEIYGEEGKDLIFGGSNADMIDAGDFDDVVFGGHGDDNINGGSGNDVLHGDESSDKINGNSGDDVMFGGSGTDNMSGGTGDDTMFGGTQSDRLKGGDGDDTLDGGMGADILEGGFGSDTFVFAGTANDDIINDFEIGFDTIDLTAYGPISLEDALAAVSQVGGNTVIDLGANGSVTLMNIQLSDMTLGDIEFLLDLGDDLLEPEVLPEIVAVG